MCSLLVSTVLNWYEVQSCEVQMIKNLEVVGAFSAKKNFPEKIHFDDLPHQQTGGAGVNPCIKDHFNGIREVFKTNRETWRSARKPGDSRVNR